MKSYYQTLQKCGFNFHYGNGKATVKQNRKVELDISDDYGSHTTRVCRVLDLKECMYLDDKYGPVCWPCYRVLHPTSKKSKK